MHSVTADHFIWKYPQNFQKAQANLQDRDTSRKTEDSFIPPNINLFLRLNQNEEFLHHFKAIPSMATQGYLRVCYVQFVCYNTCNKLVVKITCDAESTLSFPLSVSINIHRAITLWRGLPLSTPSQKREKDWWNEQVIETKQQKTHDSLR